MTGEVVLQVAERTAPVVEWMPAEVSLRVATPLVAWDSARKVVKQTGDEVTANTREFEALQIR